MIPGTSVKGDDATKGDHSSKGEKKRDDKPLVCYNCGVRGHTLRQCPSEALYCGEESL